MYKQVATTLKPPRMRPMRRLQYIKPSKQRPARFELTAQGEAAVRAMQERAAPNRLRCVICAATEHIYQGTVCVECAR